MKIKFCINCVLFKKLMKCACKNLWSISWIRVRLWNIRPRTVLNGENLEIMIFKQLKQTMIFLRIPGVDRWYVNCSFIDVICTIYLFAEEIHKSFAKAMLLNFLFYSAMNIKLNVSAVMNMIALLIET